MEMKKKRQSKPLPGSEEPGIPGSDPADQYGLERVGFKEKEAEGDQQDGRVEGRAEERLFEERTEFPLDGAGDPARGLSQAHEVIGKKTGSDDQQHLDHHALGYFFPRSDQDGS